MELFAFYDSLYFQFILFEAKQNKNQSNEKRKANFPTIQI